MLTRELKSKKVLLVAKPSVISNAQKVAVMSGLSFNELISRLLVSCIQNNKQLIDEYNIRENRVPIKLEVNNNEAQIHGRV